MPTLTVRIVAFALCFHSDEEGRQVQYCMFMANNTVVSQPFYYHNMTQALTDHAVHFIKDKSAQDTPFLYVMVNLLSSRGG